MDIINNIDSNDLIIIDDDKSLNGLPDNLKERLILTDSSDIVINPELDSLLVKIFGNGADERYLQDFVSMTKRGLYSFDKTHLNNFLNYDYHLVASPMKPLTLKDLPQNILDILMQTKYPENINTAIDISKIN